MLATLYFTIEQAQQAAEKYLIENGVNDMIMEQIEDTYKLKDNTKRLNDLIFARKMAISCITYGTDSDFFDVQTDTIGHYAQDYARTLTKDEIRQIYVTQKKYMIEHATIHENTSVDCDGISYNSITWT